MLIEISDQSITYAEEEGNMILHYSHQGDLVLIEILDFKDFLENNFNHKTNKNMSKF